MKKNVYYIKNYVKNYPSLEMSPQKMGDFWTILPNLNRDQERFQESKKEKDKKVSPIKRDKENVKLENKKVEQLVNRVVNMRPRKLRNNTQRALRSLLMSDGMVVSCRSLRIPSGDSRLRDLRKEQYGGFRLECLRTKKATYYRLDPQTVTLDRVQKVFKGVV